MAQTVCVIVTAEERVRLAAIVGDRSRPLKHVQCARIVLHSADRLSVLEVGASRQRKPPGGLAVAAALRRRRHGRAPARQDPSAGHGARADDDSRQGAGAYLRRTAGRDDPLDRTRNGGCRGPLVAHDPAHLGAPRLQPHRLRTFKHSKVPNFAEKVEDIVGLYMHPPAHAVVLSIDEKSQIQALDRTQPGLPLKPGKCGTMTHDYKRHGTTTLFAAFNVLD